MISEKLLHYVWKNTIYSTFNFQSTKGNSLQIIHPGYPHQDAGPDFKQAIIKIDDIIWAGDVEIHINSSDWYKHNHQQDEKYKSVILHVVYAFDQEVFINNVEPITTFELQHYISKQMLENYSELIHSNFQLPCFQRVQTIKQESSDYSQLLFSSLYSRMIAERVEERQKTIFQIVNQSHGDWNETLFKLIAINFGFKTNSPAFEMLSKSIPYKYLKAHSNNHLQVYALLFGQSGMLEEQIEDDYYQTLQNEYFYLRRLYKLVPIHPKNWNLLRLRPQNFPCIRIAQLSEVIHHFPELFYRIENHTEKAQFEKLFILETDPYWQTHYHFGKKSKEHTTIIGKSTFDLLMINSIIPALYAYGTFSGKDELQERAIDLLTQIEPEQNTILKTYQEIGFPINNAFESQAILQLSKMYCKKKECLECSIGQKMLL